MDLDARNQGSGIDVLLGGTDQFARQAADRVVFLRGGQIVEQGPPEQVIDDPREQGHPGFLGANSR